MTLFTGILAAAAAIIGAWWTKREPPGQVDFVDVRIIDKVFEYNIKLPEVRVRVQNTGDKGVVITQAKFHVNNSWNLGLQIPYAAALPISAEYGVKFDPNKAPPYTKVVEVSHSLEPDTADYFTFTLDLERPRASVLEVLYHLTFELTYNGALTTEPKELVCVIPDRASAEPSYFMEEYNERWDFTRQQGPPYGEYTQQSLQFFQENLEAAKEIDKDNRNVVSQVADLEAEFSSRVQELVEKAKRT